MFAPHLQEDFAAKVRAAIRVRDRKRTLATSEVHARIVGDAACAGESAR